MDRHVEDDGMTHRVAEVVGRPERARVTAEIRTDGHEFTDRAVATEIRKVLSSAVANAEHNDEIDPNELYVSACYADEGPTLKRWRPRARGRATRIRKRTCHITIIVSRMSPKLLEQRQARTAAAVGRGGVRRDAAEARRARVAKSQAARAAREAEHDHDHEGHDHDHDHDHEDVVPGEPTEATIEAAQEAEEADVDVTDEVIEAAEAEVPGEPSEAVIEAVEEAAEAQAEDESEADASEEKS